MQSIIQPDMSENKCIFISTHDLSVYQPIEALIDSLCLPSRSEDEELQQFHDDDNQHEQRDNPIYGNICMDGVGKSRPVTISHTSAYLLWADLCYFELNVVLFTLTFAYTDVYFIFIVYIVGKTNSIFTIYSL